MFRSRCYPRDVRIGDREDFEGMAVLTEKKNKNCLMYQINSVLYWERREKREGRKSETGGR